MGGFLLRKSPNGPASGLRVGVFLSDIFDAEIVNDSTEGDGTGFVTEKTGCVFARVVAGLGDVLDEALVGKDSILWIFIRKIVAQRRIMILVRDGSMYLDHLLLGYHSLDTKTPIHS
jgi:hypothetical protein